MQIVDKENIKGLSERWIKNKEYFHIKPVITFLNNKKITVEIEDAPEKYKGKLIELLKDVIGIGFKEVSELFCHQVIFQEDKEAEAARTKAHLYANLEAYLTLLAEHGYDAFKDRIIADYHFFVLQYQIQSVYCENGTWKRRNGDVFTECGWMDKDGDTYPDEAAEYLYRKIFKDYSDIPEEYFRKNLKHTA